MAYYAGKEEYDFTLFEDNAARKIVTDTAAPKIEPQTAPERKTSVRRAPSRAGKLRPVALFAAIILVSTILVACFSIPLSLRAQNDSLTEQIGDLNRAIAMESNNAKTLDNRIDAMFTKKEVESYAENVLGMIKLDNYNTIQLRLPKENEIVISGGKQMSGVVRTDNIFDVVEPDS